jgi:hypothetical protein
MKKVFSNNSELAHVWANQLQDEGRGSSMYFNGPVIYSYGPHYEIARFLTTEQGEKVCFLNTNGYSNSTAKHTSHVLNAVQDGIKLFKVPFPGNQITIDKLRNVLIQLKVNISSLLDQQIKAKSNFKYFLDARDTLENASEIAALFNLSGFTVADFPNWTAANDKYQHLRATESKRLEEKQAKELEKKLETLKKWLSGEFNGTLYGIPVHLRLINDGKDIQTTMGARVPLEAAKRLYNKLKSGLDCKGDKIEGFTVIENNPDTIKIGCHVIPWTIANNFFAQVN